MLQFYLISVLIWSVVIFCTILVFQNQIIENGWLNGEYGNTAPGGPFRIFLVAAIPVVRFSVFVAMLYMATHTEEYYQETRRKHDEDE